MTIPRIVPTLAVLVLASVLAFAAAVVHECGHFLAGTLCGMECRFIVVGRLLLRRERGKLKPALNKSLWMAGGPVLMVPSGANNLVARGAWMVAGGPLVSLALALIAFGAHLALGNRPGTGICWVIEILSAAIFAATAIPMRIGRGLLTDGARLLMLWKGGPDAEQWCLQLARLGENVPTSPKP
jgi:membrane-associated protease RseP (regulator of RpoE activity)